MLTKLATFRGVSPHGEPLVRLFEPQFALTKEAGTLMPDIRQWLSSYKPDPSKIAVLVNALGSSEFWGQNVNGDIFPEASLIHDCRNHKDQDHPYDSFTGKVIPPYGYWTFLNALPFVHHRNKDPNRAFGHVALACWNPRMHRVELVVIIDKYLALQHGAQDVVDRILAGEYPDVSMGCRVPYDVCSICSNKSKTRDDYCACVKEIGMGKILDDGRRIGVYNPHPRFFDISFVFIGADKTAKVMCKLASGIIVPQSVADAELLYGLEIDRPSGGITKAASMYQPDPADDADTRLLMGKIDDQESASAIGDGVLRSNLGTRDEEDSAGVDRTSKTAPTVQPIPLPKRPPTQVVHGTNDPRPEFADHYLAKGAEDLIPGGRADNKPDSAFSKTQLEMGKKVEREHTGSTQLAKEIAKDHLTELPDYYSRLEKMEKEAQGVKAMFEAAKAIKIGAPPTPNRKNYPFVGTIEFRGLTIHVENKPGDVRSGQDPSGKKWQTTMRLPYGEIVGTLGTDRDKLDVYVGPSRGAENVYIVHQNFVRGPKAGTYDEDKVMLGFESIEQAKAAYLAHYDDPRYLRSVTVMSFPLFKKAIRKQEAHGEKMASAWASQVADLVVEDTFRVTALEPTKTKVAASLEDLFVGAATAKRRQRVWRDKVTGNESKVTGSGLKGWDSADPKTKTASVTKNEKLAQVLQFGWAPLDLLKVSNETKAAAHLKWADILKQIGPSKAVGRVTPLLSESEPDLPTPLLNKIGGMSLEDGLSTLSLLGLVLKPQEFQRVFLTHMKKPELANQLDAQGRLFHPTEKSSPPCAPLDACHLDKKLLQELLPHLEDKSYVGPVVRRRIIRITLMKPSSHPPLTEVDSPLLSKVASAYTWYRKEIMKLARDIPSTVVSHPELHAQVLGLKAEDLFSKTAADLGLHPNTVAMLLGTVPLTLLYAAHQQGRLEKGMDVGLVDTLIAEHPWLTSMGVVSGLGALLRNPRTQKAVEDVISAGERLWYGKSVPATSV